MRIGSSFAARRGRTPRRSPGEPWSANAPPGSPAPSPCPSPWCERPPN